MAHDIENEGGYKKPPKAFQFQKGRSGNPSGRPRKAKGIPELLGKVAKQKILTVDREFGLVICLSVLDFLRKPFDRRSLALFGDGFLDGGWQILSPDSLLFGLDGGTCE